MVPSRSDRRAHRCGKLLIVEHQKWLFWVNRAMHDLPNNIDQPQQSCFCGDYTGAVPSGELDTERHKVIFTSPAI